MTVLEGIQKSAEFLGRREVDSPRLQAELLLAHVLGLPRMQLYLKFDHELQPAQVDVLRELVRRRGQREPLQHIVGSVSFCGFEIAVSPGVLVPRPETELLAEAGWEFLAGLPGSSPTALDVGTGSGCIAITIAHKCPSARVTAIDASPEAIAIATRNAAKHEVTDRVELIHSDGFKALAPGTGYDLIISNPPYIPSAEIESLQPEVRNHDPREALDGGPDGLDWYRRLAGEAGTFLKSGGKIMMEFGDGQAESVRGIFENQKWIVEGVLDDYTRRPRILIARR